MSDLLPTLGPKIGGAARALSLDIWNATRFCGRGLRKLGRVVLYLLPVLVVAHLVATVVTGRMLNREMARLRESGDVLTIEEVIPAVPPGEQNAADLYQQAFDALRIAEDEELKLWGIQGVPPIEEDARLALAREVVAANARYFDLLEQATRTSACAFPISWDQGLRARFDHLPSMRTSARMLALRADVLAADGRLGDALASSAAIFRIAEHAKMEPTLIGQLVGYAMHGFAVGAFERTLSSGSPAPDDLRHLFAQLAAIDNRTPSVRAVRGEVAIWGVPLFDMVRQNTVSFADMQTGAAFEDQQSSGPRLRPALAYRVLQTVMRPLINLDEITYLQCMEGNIRAMSAAWPESKKLAEETQNGIQRVPSYRRILTDMLVPVFARAIEARDSRTALVRAAQVALALTAFHAEHGAYPGSLTELETAGWDLPSDPFGGAPLHFRTEGDGFVVWSVGPDMDDDGGRPFDREAYESREFQTTEEQEKAYRDYDVVFRVER